MKKIKILISLFFILCFCKTSILGFSNINLKIQSSKENIGKNEEVFVTVYCPSNLKEDIKRIECTLEYDKNIFNEITKNDLLLYNIGKSIDFNEENCTLIVSNIKSENIFKIRLTTKQDVKNTTTNIKLREVRVLTNNGYINIGTVSSKLKVNNNNIATNTNNTNMNSSIVAVDNEFLSDNIALVDQIGEFMSFDSLKNIDMSTLFLNPFKIFGIFIKAFIIVIVINLLAKLICKVFFSYSDILSRRRKSRKLKKVLNSIYE